MHLGKGFEDRVGWNSAKLDWKPGNPVIDPKWDDQHWYEKFKDYQDGHLSSSGRPWMRRFRRRTHPLQRKLRVQMELRGKARQLRLRVFNYSVPEWSIMVAATAPSEGADIDEVAHFIRRTCAIADIFHQGTMVCHSRPDGFGHCVLQRGGRYLCFQHSDEGVDFTRVVNEPANSIAYCWTFVESVY